jgi:NAD-dependent SIR2 family protein deacetylase
VDDRENRKEEPPVDDSVRCSGCETSRQWERFDAPPDDVDAIGTCPDCGTHILGFDVITEDEREEWAKFCRSFTGFAESDAHANGGISS